MESYFKKRGAGDALHYGESKRARQGKLTDCKKVVSLREIEELGTVLEASLRALTKLELCMTETKRETEGIEEEGEEEETNRRYSFEVRNVENCLEKLESMFISLETLEKTKIGRTVNKLTKPLAFSLPKSVVKKANNLVERWKETARAGSQIRKKQARDEKEGRVPLCRRVN